MCVCVKYMTHVVTDFHVPSFYFPAPPNLVEKSSHAVGSLAGSVVLPCHFSKLMFSTSTPHTWTDDEQLRIKWTKLEAEGEKVVLVSQAGVVKIGSAFLNRVVVKKRPLSDGDASLTMLGLRASDAGLYRCEVMLGMEDAQDTVRLNVTGE